MKLFPTIDFDRVNNSKLLNFMMYFSVKILNIMYNEA